MKSVGGDFHIPPGTDSAPQHPHIIASRSKTDRGKRTFALRGRGVIGRAKVVECDSEEAGRERPCRYQALTGIPVTGKKQTAAGLREEARSIAQNIADHPFRGFDRSAVEVVVNLRTCYVTEKQR